MNQLAPTKSQARTTARRRATAVLLTPVVAGTAAVALASPASAFTPVAGAGVLADFPAAYQDGNVTLQPCVDGSPQCGGTTAASVTPAADGEFFYNSMEGEVVGADGRDSGVKVVIGLEGAYPDGPPEVFARTRFRALGVGNGSVANATYTINHPYGTATFTTDSRGIGGVTDDITCAAGAPCGPTRFITSAAYSPGDAYVGNGASEQLVAAANAVTVTAVSTAGTKTVTGNQFVVMGKVAAGGTTTPPGPTDPAVTPPGAPTSVRATRGQSGGEITAGLSWIAPTNTGGAGVALTGYTVRAFAGGTPVGDPRTVTGTNLTWTFAKKGNYSFTITANNRVGSSASVRSNTVRAR